MKAKNETETVVAERPRISRAGPKRTAHEMFGMTLDELCINTIRMLAVDAVEQAQSGHAGLPMGAAPMAYVLWTHFLKHNPRDPHWPDRDRFVLSAGHGSMLLYSLLHLTGYDMPLEQLKRFRQWDSMTAGHPEAELAAGIETTTGPLGQGISNAVGMAIAEKHLAAAYNKNGPGIVDHRTYVIASDGDMMEGVQSEAASLAGHLGLGKLVVLYDDNGTTIDGPTSLAFSEDVVARYAAYGWHTQRVEDGTDLVAIDTAIEHAIVEENRPSLIAVRTVIGYGNPKREGTAKAHSDPFGPEEVKLTKENLGWPLEPTFLIPDPVLAHMRQAIDHGEEAEERWKADFQVLKAEWPGLARAFERSLTRALPDGWTNLLPRFTPADKPIATREASGKVINAIAGELPELIGGSADLAPSNKTYIEESTDFEAESPAGRNLRFGVREHAMGAILNGISAHGGLRPFGGTFLIFSDYMRPSIRLAALMKQPVIYVFTHDSVGLGEDGPTHQPIEHLASLRAIPNLVLIRPADAAETVVAWRAALERKDGPTALALTRQKVPHLERGEDASAKGLLRGGYVLAELPDSDGPPDVILIGTGSEVQVALAAARRLAAEEGTRARVVSLPSWELFERQSAAYREGVLPHEVRARVSVEAGSPLGWERYTGRDGAIVGIERFGASAPGDVVLDKLGFNQENVLRHARHVLEVSRKSRAGQDPPAGRGKTRTARAAGGHSGGTQSASRSPGSSRHAGATARPLAAPAATGGASSQGGKLGKRSSRSGGSGGGSHGRG